MSHKTKSPSKGGIDPEKQNLGPSAEGFLPVNSGHRTRPKEPKPAMSTLPPAVNTGEKQETGPGPRFVNLPGTKEVGPATKGDGVLRVYATQNETQDDVSARIAMHPTMQNTFIAKAFAEGRLDPGKGNRLSGPLDITACAEQMVQKLEALGRTDLTEAKQMLLGQATALQAIFMEMSRRAALNMGEYLGPTETYMRLALKAQSQCRATIETLAEIVQPRPVFVNPGQVNMAAGPQQVNNGHSHSPPQPVSAAPTDSPAQAPLYALTREREKNPSVQTIEKDGND